LLRNCLIGPSSLRVSAPKSTKTPIKSQRTGQLNPLQDAEEAPGGAHLLPYKAPTKVVDFLEVPPLRGGEVVVLGVVIIRRGLPVFPG
jgi:hypothetical protein